LHDQDRRGVVVTELLADLALTTARRRPAAPCLVAGERHWTYGEFAQAVHGVARGLLSVGIQRHERVAVYGEKTLESVAAMFGASRAGAVFVPINPLLKPPQVAHILRDCDVRVLVTTPRRREMLAEVLPGCDALRHVVVVGGAGGSGSGGGTGPGTGTDAVRGAGARDGDHGPADSTTAGSSAPAAPFDEHDFAAFCRRPADFAPHRAIETDMTAILYTSGSTGLPKGVVLSHRNMVAGARSVASYLENRDDDRILAALPLSFDAGLSQLTTAFSVGATVVLHDYLIPQDAIRALERERITGLAGVPPLWMQLAAIDWPEAVGAHLRYFTNTGGKMPQATLAQLRQKAPRARPYLMYGLTEAFRSTYLPPEEVDRRPDSIGKAIPNVEILVVRDDGTPAGADEPGELVHRGPLVALGYWNDRQRTAERFRPLPGQHPELPLTEIAVWSGDTVRRDPDGFLYFVGRRDDMIKCSGYRVSPTEVEEAVFRTGLVGEAAAIGVPHPALGQAIVVVAVPKAGAGDTRALLAACRDELPGYMMPAAVEWVATALPRNPNGKIDRKLLAGRLAESSAAGAG
jgi:acyl-CoA ligase (AMP-forming) (exosortase A-associated)